MKKLEDFEPKKIPGGLCGVDEAGRGPVIGPMVVAGVLVDEDSELRRIGVRDSKKLSPGRREVLAMEIKSVAKYDMVIASAEDIDALRQSFTLNVIESRMFATVIERLGGKTAYVDAADTNEEEFQRLVSSELKSDVKVTAKHEADSIYPVVSAASIIAKTKRDAMIEDIKKEIGQDLGSGYPSDKKTIEFIKRWVREHGDLPPHTRRSWKTVRNIMNDMGITKLDAFTSISKIE
jgi:ribonuclease HII